MNNSKGFTLVEVLVALMIVSLVFLSGTMSLSEMIHDSENLRLKTLAALIASNIVTEIQIGLINIDSNERSNLINRITMANEDFVWHAKKEKALLAGSDKITIQVQSSSGVNLHQLEGYIHAK
jgi:type II secretion system protein I